MERGLKISLESYSKIFLHAAKYPECPILGFIIGSEVNKEILITDVFPICHSYPSGPIIDIGGQTAEKILKPQTKILGVYFANDRNVDENIPVFIERLVNGLKDVVGECLVVQVKNSLLSDRTKLFIEARRGCSSDRSIPCETIDSISSVNTALDTLLVDNSQIKFSDFEDHLNGGATDSKDFRNLFVNNFLAKN